MFSWSFALVDRELITWSRNSDKSVTQLVLSQFSAWHRLGKGLLKGEMKREWRKRGRKQGVKEWIDGWRDGKRGYLRAAIKCVQATLCRESTHRSGAMSPALQRQTLADMGSDCKYSGRITLTLNSVWYILYLLSAMNTTHLRILSSGWVSLVLRGMLFFNSHWARLIPSA